MPAGLPKTLQTHLTQDITLGETDKRRGMSFPDESHSRQRQRAMSLPSRDVLPQYMDAPNGGGMDPADLWHKNGYSSAADDLNKHYGFSKSRVEMSYKTIPHAKPRLSTQRQLYYAALESRTEELDALRQKLGIPVGRMPQLPSHSHPWLRKWSKPLIGRFSYLIRAEMHRAHAAEIETARNTIANSGVTIVPIVQPVLETYAN